LLTVRSSIPFIQDTLRFTAPGSRNIQVREELVIHGSCGRRRAIEWLPPPGWISEDRLNNTATVNTLFAGGCGREGAEHVRMFRERRLAGKDEW